MTALWQAVWYTIQLESLQNKSIMIISLMVHIEGIKTWSFLMANVQV